MAQKLHVGNRSEIEHFTESLTGTDDWTNMDFTCEGSMKIDHIAVEKPSSTLLTITILYPDGGATVLAVNSKSGVTSGIYLDTSNFSLPPLTIIRLSSTGGISGDKVVTLLMARADA